MRIVASEDLVASPKVSVCIITYNQARYIAKAIDGALNQEVDFPYEIIIGDDASTDGTTEILLEYQKKYPKLIKLNLHQQRYTEGILGRLNNITNINAARGKYIAFCDGDDYWISTNKLQKQADFMDENPQISFSFNDAKYIWEDSEREYRISDYYFRCRKNKIFHRKDIVFKDFQLPASSTFYRSKYIKNLPEWFWDVYSADYALQFIALEHGAAFFFQDILTVQLKNKGSVSQNHFKKIGLSKIYKNDKELYKKNISFYEKYYWKTKSSQQFKKLALAKKRKNYFSSVKALVLSIYYDVKTVRMILNIIMDKCYRLYTQT